MDNTINVSIVLITRNRLLILKRTIYSLLPFLDSNDVELIVVDDSSTDGTIDYLEELSSSNTNIKLVLNKSNLGIAKSRNKGIIFSSGQIIISMDDDILIASNTIDVARKMLHSNPQIGILAPLVIDADTGLYVNGVKFDEGCHIKYVSNYCGGFSIFRRNAVVTAGLIDEEISFGGEERSLSIKVHSIGYDIVFSPLLKGYHFDTISRTKPILSRYKKRVYNNVRLNYKYLSFFNATLYSFRYFLLMVIIGRSLFPIGSIQIFLSYIRGIIKGLCQREKIPQRTVDYYTSSKLEPHYGNQPLISRLYKSNKHE